MATIKKELGSVLQAGPLLFGLPCWVAKPGNPAAASVLISLLQKAASGGNDEASVEYLAEECVEPIDDARHDCTLAFEHGPQADLGDLLGAQDAHVHESGCFGTGDSVEFGGGDARVEGGHAHAAVFEFVTQRLGEGHDIGLGRGVGRDVGGGEKGGC